MNPKSISTRTCILLILLFAIAAYANTLHSPFQSDDGPNILENHALRPMNLGKLWHFLPTRFITDLSFAFNLYLAGFQTWSFHIFNLLIHILASLVVFKLTLSILNTPAMKDQVPSSQQPLFALASALLFTAHPLQTQAVTYIVQRATSMATLFYLAALWMYLKARLENTRYYPAVFLFMLAAMFTKEISFTLPFAILLFELFFFPLSEQETLRKKMLRWLPFAAFLVIIPFLFIISREKYALAGGSMGILPSLEAQISRWDYLLTEFRVLRTYLRLLVFPVNQCLFFDYRISSAWGDPDTWAAFSLLVSLLILSLAFFKKNRLLAFGVLWFFLTLSVESSLIPITDVIFEHRLYLPMFGFVIFLTSLLWQCVRSATRFLALSLLITVVLSGMTYARNEVWKSKISLAQDTAKKAPLRGISYATLGDAYIEIGDDKVAAICYQKALALGFVAPWVYANLTVIYSRLGEHEKSLHFQKIILSSSFLKKNLPFYDKDAFALIKADRNPEAIERLKENIRTSPENPILYIQLGEAYRRMQREADAVFSFRKAIELAPLSKEGYEALALFYNKKGEKEKAVAVLVEYLKQKKKHKPLFGD